MRPWMRWSKTHEKLLEVSQNVLVCFQGFYLRWCSLGLQWRWHILPSMAASATFVFQSSTDCPGRFSSAFDQPIQFFLLVSGFFQTELLWCPTHCALLKDTLLNFSCRGMQIFTCLAWFLMRNRLLEFSIFHDGVPTDLYTQYGLFWQSLWPYFPYTSSYWPMSHRILFLSAFFLRCFRGLHLLWSVYFWCVYFFFYFHCL